MDTVQAWRQHADSLARARRVGRQLVDKGQGNLYQIGNAFFESAFALFVAQSETEEGRSQLQEALAIYRLAVERDDCARWPEYPFNLAHLLLETYLGQWLLSEATDATLLSGAINRYVDGLFDGRPHPLASFAVLPPAYLLHGDEEQLAAFWQQMGEKSAPAEYPAELRLWWRWSQAVLEDRATPDAFRQLYADYRRQAGQPTDQLARFYLASAAIGVGQFGLTEDRALIIRRLAGVMGV